MMVHTKLNTMLFVLSFSVYVFVLQYYLQYSMCLYREYVWARESPEYFLHHFVILSELTGGGGGGLARQIVEIDSGTEIICFGLTRVSILVGNTRSVGENCVLLSFLR